MNKPDFYDGNGDGDEGQQNGDGSKVYNLLNVRGLIGNS